MVRAAARRLVITWGEKMGKTENWRHRCRRARRNLRHGPREQYFVDVPGEISLVGFDKSDKFGEVFRRITTVDVNIDAMVQYACWYLSACLNGNAPKLPAKIQISTTIVDNQTVRPL